MCGPESVRFGPRAKVKVGRPHLLVLLSPDDLLWSNRSVPTTLHGTRPQSQTPSQAFSEPACKISRSWHIYPGHSLLKYLLKHASLFFATHIKSFMDTQSNSTFSYSFFFSTSLAHSIDELLSYLNKVIWMELDCFFLALISRQLDVL